MRVRAPMYPYVAPHTSKIHTLITLGISIRAKPLVLKARKRLPRGFDSHRPLQLAVRMPANVSRSPRRPRLPPCVAWYDRLHELIEHGNCECGLAVIRAPHHPLRN